MFPLQAGRVEGSAEQRWTLRPGDVLYLPGGHWHCARAESESVSLSFGMMPPTLTDALEYVRRLLVRSPEWRTRLAPLGRASPLGDTEQLALLHQHFQKLAQEVTAELSSPQFALRFLADTARTFLAQEPITQLRPSQKSARPRTR